MMVDLKHSKDAVNKLCAFITYTVALLAGRGQLLYLGCKVTKHQDKKMLPLTGHTPWPAFLSGRRAFVFTKNMSLRGACNGNELGATW